MAEPAAPAPALAMPKCMTPTGETRRTIFQWADGWSRVRLCKPPFTCSKWRLGDEIPVEWEEVPPGALEKRFLKGCEVTIMAAVNQQTAASIGAAGAAASRPPRPPRVARTPRAPRFPRQPRPPRARRPPRPARPPRPPRPMRKRAERPERGKFYCFYFKRKPDSDWELSGHTGPWTRNIVEQQEAAGHKAVEVPQHLPCPNFGRSLCAEGVAAVARPLQDLLGWKRPEYPTPEEVMERRRVARAAPRPVAPTPQAPIPPPPNEPPPLVFQPPESAWACMRDSAFNRVDCYVVATGRIFWSNWQHGEWAGVPALPGMPLNAGVGA